MNKGSCSNARPFKLMVRLAGIEPTTPWFVAHPSEYYKNHIKQRLTGLRLDNRIYGLGAVTPCFYWFGTSSIVQIKRLIHTALLIALMSLHGQ